MKPMNTFIIIEQNGSTFGRLQIWFSLGKLEKIRLLIFFSVFYGTCYKLNFNIIRFRCVAPKRYCHIIQYLEQIVAVCTGNPNWNNIHMTYSDNDFAVWDTQTFMCCNLIISLIYTRQHI